MKGRKSKEEVELKWLFLWIVIDKGCQGDAAEEKTNVGEHGKSIQTLRFYKNAGHPLFALHLHISCEWHHTQHVRTVQFRSLFPPSLGQRVHFNHHTIDLITRRSLSLRVWQGQTSHEEVTKTNISEFHSMAQWLCESCPSPSFACLCSVMNWTLRALGESGGKSRSEGRGEVGQRSGGQRGECRNRLLNRCSNSISTLLNVVCRGPVVTLDPLSLVHTGGSGWVGGWWVGGEA